MQLNSDVLSRVTYLTGSAELIAELPMLPAKKPFDDSVIDFLNAVSREIMLDARSRAYSDVVAFGFWIRRSSLLKLRERFASDSFRMGKGLVFHVAPSNVPVNFAYSLIAGLLTGNGNVVRVPSKVFSQVSIIIEAFTKVLEKYPNMKPYIICVRYGRDKEVNDLFSSIADMRIVWGGDNTIAELRKSPLPPRSGEITFADRYSLAFIDSDVYLSMEDKDRVAEDFYNDTFFSDQNACTSPRLIVWSGSKMEEGKEVFWQKAHELVKKKYTFQAIQGVNKLTTAYLFASVEPEGQVEPHQDNLIVRIKVPRLTDFLMDYRDNSGYFYEYECHDILELIPICNDKRCQTIAYIGRYEVFLPLLKNGIKGIDRIVPLGKTMEFDLIWDGYHLPALLTRVVAVGV